MKSSPQFADLLERAITDPGLVSLAYSAFHHYSIGNQILALVQCAERGIPPGPIATFMGWKEKGRHVRRGERAIILCMPVTCKRQPASDQTDPEVFTRFVFRPHWFVLSQTDGAPVDATPIPD
jgi:N-terminal domain of anti-restriction factor ArdC